MASVFKRGTDKSARNAVYWIDYVDEFGRRRRVKGYSDKRLSEQLAAKLEQEARSRTYGLVDEQAEQMADLQSASIEGIIHEYQDSFGEVTAKHIKLTTFRVRRLFDKAKISSLSEISESNVERALKALRREKNLGARTYNHYLQAVAGFCNWCVKTKKLLRNPVVSISPLNTATDIRHQRRALTPTEFDALLQATRASGRTVKSLGSEERARIYLFSYLTGLRKKEMGSLTPAHFRLDDNPPTVTVDAACSKHRRKDVLPLHPELCSMLREWLTGLGPTDKLFPLVARKKLSEMIQIDLKAAGIPYETKEGIADFHAAGRHTYITQLLRSGASLPEAQALARHTDIQMTMRYTHIGIDDQAKAVAGLPVPRSAHDGANNGSNQHLSQHSAPRPSADTLPREELGAKSSQHFSQHLRRPTGQTEETAGTRRHTKRAKEIGRKIVSDKDFGNAKQGESLDVADSPKTPKSGGHGTRTRNWQASI